MTPPSPPTRPAALPLRPVRAGSIGVTRGRHLVDRVIQVGTSSRYNHVAVSVGVGSRGWPICVEASPGGATRQEVDPARFVWDRLPLSPLQRQAIAGAAEACVGLPYDWRDIARFVVLHRVGKARGWTRDHPDTHVICSEVAVWALQVAGVDAWPGIAPGDVSPGDVADLLFRCASPRTLEPWLPDWRPPQNWRERYEPR